MANAKKKSIPTLSRFDAENDSVYIFEEIMFRQHWTVAGRDTLAAKIESIVDKELQRQEKHREKVILIKRFNASIDNPCK